MFMGLWYTQKMGNHRIDSDLGFHKMRGMFLFWGLHQVYVFGKRPHKLVVAKQQKHNILFVMVFNISQHRQHCIFSPICSLLGCIMLRILKGRKHSCRSDSARQDVKWNTKKKCPKQGGRTRFFGDFWWPPFVLGPLKLLQLEDLQSEAIFH